MAKDNPVLFRPRPDQAEKIQRLGACAGGNFSEAMRQIVDCVEFDEVEVMVKQPSIRFINPVNANSDTTLAGIRVAVAA